MNKPIFKKVNSESGSEKKLSDGAIRFACKGGTIGMMK